MGVYVLDDSIFTELNRGNEPVANIIVRYLGGGNELWVTRSAYERLKQIPANQRLAESMGLKVPKTDPAIPSQMRGMHASHTIEGAAALALEKKGTLVTMNQQAAQLHRGLGGQVDASYQFKASQKPVDYSRTRQLLGLRPEKFTPNGNLVPQADRRKNPEPQPSLVIREKGSDRRYVPGVASPTNARTGSPIKPVVEGKLNSNPNSVAGVKLALRGVNWVIQAINDSIQGERLLESMNKVSPHIEGALKAEPSLGVLIRIHFSRRPKVGPENESSMTHTAIFRYIEYEYGHTTEEANLKLRSRRTIREALPGEEQMKDEHQDQWIAPSQPLSPAELPTPYGKAGLCTFVPGREKLLRVQFSHSMGIDEKMWSLLDLKGSQNATARFLVLFPPADIKYIWNGSPRLKELDLSLSRPAEVIDHEQLAVYLPTLDLDSWINPYDGKATMVYPADPQTEALFKQGGQISSQEALVLERVEYVRFVRPQDIRLLRYFGPTGPPA